MSDSKPTNPKDAIASGKLPLHLVPDALKAYCALALAEGAMKYGTANWRAAGVRTSIYIAALGRHLGKWWNGEECDPVTKVPHLANAVACLAIIIDAKHSGKLTDDRPPAQPDLSALIDGFAANVEHLQQLFADKHPKHWSINDNIPEEALA
ncbi:hypothetical protein BSL82_09980 [Tardibacter chloracetimidivorans]|uniref:dATP/dGTP diphosphohydrolase N-terminal domain-containing protein n=1 Tax=Tardibacter chloracetimidivorans TaxID=1921510 RepID=A0A1L3ZVD8_9SPHN|nr:dATP/dGTP diphosphohydrolase domain-containing protein [Tardibacter chloracetimidivorans]API59601.1 hypothetical protein BSL82_09980 [Tardibacter chloracetimidivorans]